MLKRVLSIPLIISAGLKTGQKVTQGTGVSSHKSLMKVRMLKAVEMEKRTFAHLSAFVTGTAVDFAFFYNGQKRRKLLLVTPSFCNNSANDTTTRSIKDIPLSGGVRKFSALGGVDDPTPKNVLRKSKFLEDRSSLTSTQITASLMKLSSNPKYRRAAPHSSKFVGCSMVGEPSRYPRNAEELLASSDMLWTHS